MVIIVTGDTLFVRSQYDIIFRFATKVLGKFVDPTCMFSDARAAVGLEEQYNSSGQWKLIKTNNYNLLCLFLFINN